MAEKIQNLEDLLSTVKLRAAFDKRIGEADLSLLVIKDHYKRKGWFDKYDIVAQVFNECGQKIENDAKRKYTPRLTETVENALAYASQDFDKTLENSKISTFIDFVKEMGYTGSIEDIKRYLIGYAGMTYKSIIESKSENDKKAKTALSVLTKVIFNYAEHDIDKLKVKNFDKNVEAALKELYEGKEKAESS